MCTTTAWSVRSDRMQIVEKKEFFLYLSKRTQGGSGKSLGRSMVFSLNFFYLSVSLEFNVSLKKKRIICSIIKWTNTIGSFLLVATFRHFAPKQFSP